MSDDDIYLSPAKIDEIWEKMKKRAPETKREDAKQLAKMFAKDEADEQERVELFCKCINRVFDVVKHDKEWIANMVWLARIEPEDFFAGMHALTNALGKKTPQ
jgi:hypothetical protein